MPADRPTSLSYASPRKLNSITAAAIPDAPRPKRAPATISDHGVSAHRADPVSVSVPFLLPARCLNRGLTPNETPAGTGRCSSWFWRRSCFWMSSSCWAR